LSAEGLSFVRRWIDENVTADWYRRDDDEGAWRLAGKCASDAFALGVEPHEIREEVGSIEAVIRKALEKASGSGSSA
jgi:hypothetical protein